MTLQAPPPPRRAWSAAWTGAVAAAVLLGMALAGLADPAPAAVAAMTVALAAVWQTGRADRVRRAGLASGGRAGERPAHADAPFAELFERLPDPALLVAGGQPDDLASRRVLVANAAARDLLRIPREDALLVSALRHPEVLEALDESLFGGLTRLSSWSSGGAQDRVWRAWSAPAPAPEGDGEPRALLILHEETDVRRAERTRADFLANASHELRTPLASLAGFVETLRGHARDDDAARDRFLAIMAGQTERMARLVDDILSLSRVELNEHVPPLGLVDLSAAIRDVCDALAPLARNKGVALQAVLPAGPARVIGDRDGVVQVVQNLVDNGLNYSAAGSSVRVELAPELDADAAGRAPEPGAARVALLTPDRTADQRYAAVRVSDSGPGIEREHLPRLTERFYRVAGQKSGERPGTGLGLAIVRHIVNRHRGGLAVDSTPGGGSTFIAWFPLAPATAVAAPAAATKLS